MEHMNAPQELLATAPVHEVGSAGARAAFVVMRVTLGLIFVTHGAARIHYGSLGDFGAFLGASGLPAGPVLAWVVTIGELISGSLLAAGVAVRYAAVFHALVIVSGILLVHLPRGWFTVGHGSGGVEYSVLILAVLGYIFSRRDQPGILGWR
jgi:putative oxidoreductase